MKTQENTHTHTQVQGYYSTVQYSTQYGEMKVEVIKVA